MVFLYYVLQINMGDKAKSKEKILTKEKEEKDSWNYINCKKIFNDAKRNVIECEICGDHLFAKCMKVNEAEYSFMRSRGDLHRFCTTFDSLAIQSIIKDKDLEGKINKHIKVVIDKIFEIDIMLVEKIERNMTAEWKNFRTKT